WATSGGRGSAGPRRRAKRRLNRPAFPNGFKGRSERTGLFFERRDLIQWSRAPRVPWDKLLTASRRMGASLVVADPSRRAPPGAPQRDMESGESAATALGAPFGRLPF